MTTRAQMLARRHSAPVMVVTVDGVGNSTDGQWKFCTRRPDGYATGTAYKDWIAGWPRMVPEKLPFLGGVSRAGELSLAVIDEDDAMSAQLALLAASSAHLTAGITAAATSCTLSRVIADGLYFVGLEAIDFALNAGTTYDITRAQLGTRAQAHLFRARVYGSNPYVLNRRMRLYLSFDDAGYNVTREAEGEIGQGWQLGDFSFSDDLNAVVLRGRSRMVFLDRVVMRSQPFASITGFSPDGRVVRHEQVSNQPGMPTAWATHFDDGIYLRVGGNHIVAVDDPDQVTAVTINEVGRLGTTPGGFEIGTRLRQVYVAGPSFRYQTPGNETSLRSTGTWIETAHPIPIMLAILTSPADPNDDGPSNYGTDTGNYSALPAGVGLGVDIGDIDVDSFLDVWQREAGLEIAHFVLDENRTAREIFEDICQVFGWSLVPVQGKIALKKPRTPLQNETGTTWDRDVISSVGAPTLDTSRMISAVVFEGVDSTGRKVQSTFTNASFREVLGDPTGYYENEGRTVRIRADFLRFGVGGDEPEILRRRALTLLQTARRPQMVVPLKTDLSQIDVEPGDTVLVTHAQLRNLATGVVGWTDIPATVDVRQPVVDSNEVGVKWEVRSFGASLRAGRICPAGRISGTPTLVSGSTYRVTFTANRYTDPNSQGGLPIADGQAFNVGDRVRLTTRGDTVISTTPSYQTVTGLVVSGTPSIYRIEIDGNFGGSASFADGNVLSYVARADQVAAQYNNYVSTADETNLTVGASADMPWSYTDI